MKKIVNYIEHIFYIALAIIMLSPFIYMIITSFQETFSPYFVSLDFSEYSLNNYYNLFEISSLKYWFRNSMFISIVGVIWTLVSCISAAYAFIVKKNSSKHIIYIILFMALSIPYTATVIPQWLMMGKLNLIDTFWPLILPIPNFIGVIMIEESIESIPIEMFETARIDGVSDFIFLIKVIIPIIKPILITVSIIFFARSWNSFLWPLVMSNTDATKTLPVGLASLQGTHTVNYGLIMAGAVINFLPPFLMYLILQKQFNKGALTAGLKG